MDGQDNAALQDRLPSRQPTAHAYQRWCLSWDCRPLL